MSPLLQLILQFGCAVTLLALFWAFFSWRDYRDMQRVRRWAREQRQIALYRFAERVRHGR